MLLELAICQLLKDNPKLKSDLIVYIAPLKALCHERIVDWKEKFSQFGLSCLELTGDTKDVISSKYNFVVTTPEKWDVFTKSSLNNNVRINKT